VSDSAIALFASLLVSTAGFGLFIYGKKQRRGPHLAAGIALMGGPYLFSGTVWILTFGVAVVAATFAAARAGL
jgi:hypothetical protein